MTAKPRTKTKNLMKTTLAATGEAEHECPDEGGDLELSITPDHAEELGWKEASETTHKTS